MPISDDEREELESLANQLSTGEEDAVKPFLDFFDFRFRGYFLGHGVSEESDAEELAIICIGKIVRKIRHYRQSEHGSFYSWCWAVARHELADWHRSQNRMRRFEIPFDDSLRRHPASLSPLDVLLEQDNVSMKTHLLFESLTQLSETYRQIIELRDFRGYSFSQIADELLINEGAARVRYHRAKKCLQEILEGNQHFRQLMQPR